MPLDTQLPPDYVPRMCNVCDASHALDLTQRGLPARFLHESADFALLVEATGTSPEFEPARFRFKRPDDPDWTPWLESSDLAGSLGALGTDVKLDYVKPEVVAYLKGGPIEPVLALLAEDESAEPAARPARRTGLQTALRAAARRRAATNKRRLEQLTKALPGWTLNGKTFRNGIWSLRSLFHFVAGARGPKLSRQQVVVRGPVSFTAPLEDALRIISAVGVIAPETFKAS